MNYLNCKRLNGQKKWEKRYQKMKIFKFENTNPLWVLPYVTYQLDIINLNKIK